MPKLQGVDAGEEWRHPAVGWGGGRKETYLKCLPCQKAKPRAAGSSLSPMLPSSSLLATKYGKL